MNLAFCTLLLIAICLLLKLLEQYLEQCYSYALDKIFTTTFLRAITLQINKGEFALPLITIYLPTKFHGKPL